MEGFKDLQGRNAVFAILLICLFTSANAQIISTACSNSMVTSFTPCLNYITGSSSNGGSPTADCCDSLRSLMSYSMDCGCLIVTGNVPFSLPINRTLAISLPRACNGRLPVQCKASGVPLPAPGPVIFGANPPAATYAPISPKASKASTMAPPPAETTEEITPAVPPSASFSPTANPGIRPVLTPPISASNPSYIQSSSVLLLFVGIMVFKCY